MTSPGIPKPSSVSGGYETVHSRGSSFGQGLSPGSVRDQLIGREKPFLMGLGGMFNDFMTGLMGGFVGLIGAIIKRQPPPNETPNILSPIAADLEGALEPLLVQADTALQQAEDAGEEAVSIRERMQHEFNPAMENSFMWKLTLDRLAIDESIREAQQTAIEANTASIETLTEYVQRTFFAPADVESTGDHWETWLEGGDKVFKARPGWQGNVTFIYQKTVFLDDQTVGLWNIAVPAANGSRTYRITGFTGDAFLSYSISPGEAITDTVTGPALVLADSNTWSPVLQWEVPEDTNISAAGYFNWTSKTFLGGYYQRITLDGKNITLSSSSQGAPLIGDASRSATVSALPQAAKKGQIVRLEASAVHTNSKNRELDSPRMAITWIKSVEEEEEGIKIASNLD